MIWNEIQKELQ